MQRRTVLKLGMGSTALLLLAGGAAVLLQPGWHRGALSPLGREVFAAVGQAVLDKSLPAAEMARQTAIEGLLGRVDVLVRALPPHAQDELSQLLSLLGSTAGRRTLAGLGPAWADASVAEVQLALQGMRTASLALRQQAYAALHDIATGAYFADAATWPMLGYPGPLKI
ncbi:MAG: hypothetical protein ABIR35_09700 [Polaromonas sp.]